jgi:CheY-like chemotaxis protein
LLNQVSVLIVENEPFIALDLATAVEEARGKVIGPAGSVREALLLIEHHLVQAAVLDVNLSDRDVTPIAELLIEGGVPVIFYSGLALPAALRERYPSASIYKKPTPPVQLLNKLVALIAASQSEMKLGKAGGKSGESPAAKGFDSDDRTLSSHPTESISASLDSHQARSQSVAWFDGTLPQNKNSPEIAFRSCCTYVVSVMDVCAENFVRLIQ